jgi:uncharacterized protein YpbB
MAKKTKKEKPVSENFEEPSEIDNIPPTLLLFREGFTVEEIAKHQLMPIKEVENHIAHFVATGDLNVLSVTPKPKLIEILKAYHKLGDSSLTALRKALGDDFNFLEIRSAINYWKRVNKPK